jgi:hypothetical protein
MYCGFFLGNPLRLVHLVNESWVLNPVGSGYGATLEAAMGERQGTLHVAIDTMGPSCSFGWRPRPRSADCLSWRSRARQPFGAVALLPSAAG